MFVFFVTPPLPNALQAALIAAPYRSNFLKALSKGEEVKEEDCLANVRQFLVNYTATVDAIYEMYTDLNAELDYTVWCPRTLLDITVLCVRLFSFWFSF